MFLIHTLLNQSLLAANDAGHPTYYNVNLDAENLNETFIDEIVAKEGKHDNEAGRNALKDRIETVLTGTKFITWNEKECTYADVANLAYSLSIIEGNIRSYYHWWDYSKDENGEKNARKNTVKTCDIDGFISVAQYVYANTEMPGKSISAFTTLVQELFSISINCKLHTEDALKEHIAKILPEAKKDAEKLSKEIKRPVHMEGFCNMLKTLSDACAKVENDNKEAFAELPGGY